MKSKEERWKDMVHSMKSKKEYLDNIDKDNEYIMQRMHPAVMIPGFLIGFIVIAGCIYKGFMGW